MHPLAHWIDAAAGDLGLHPFVVPRAVLSQPVAGRQSCEYSGYCAMYGCSTGAKGSSRAALLNRAVATGRCQVRAGAMVHRINSDKRGRASGVVYSDAKGRHTVDARVYVVACQAIESARLLLNSTGPRHPDGLANSSGQVGRNLLFSAAGWAVGDFPYAGFDDRRAAELRSRTPFINRALQDWYVLSSPDTGPMKGGTLEFMMTHPNPISAAVMVADVDGGPLWGPALQERLQQYFGRSRHLKVETFNDWLPNADCRVTLDPDLRDKWGLPVARVRVHRHPHNARVADRLVDEAMTVLQKMGAHGVRGRGLGHASTNLLAGTCRFGADPARSVLDKDCRAHDVENLYVTDGSFMPTGGSVPYTFTIYANAFRVADRIARVL